jgi:hypothetical protein
MASISGTSISGTSTSGTPQILLTEDAGGVRLMADIEARRAAIAARGRSQIEHA